MAGGTPPLEDKGYELRHPDWRHSYHLTRREIRDQMLADRESGARILVGVDRWVPSVDLSRDDIEQLADDLTRRILDQAVNQDADVIDVGRGLGAR
jgi:hypothetical protein